MGDITKIEVWQLSCDLSVEIYKLTFEGKLNQDFSYRDQMRRAAISVPSNIAEGEESGFNKLGVRYFYNAKASIAELKTQLIIANKIGYIDEKQLSYYDDKIELISKKLRNLINYRKQHFK